jgi:hypothetical protein
LFRSRSCHWTIWILLHIRFSFTRWIIILMMHIKNLLDFFWISLVKTRLLLFFFLFFFRVKPSYLWSRNYPMLTFETSFKIMIIIIFILVLTWVNPGWFLSRWPCLGLTLKLIFKTMIITTFIFMFTWANLGLSLWSWPCLELTLKLSFKTMIRFYSYVDPYWPSHSVTRVLPRIDPI